MKEMPAFESRRVRTQPLTVICAWFGARPARMSRTLSSVFSMCVLLPLAGESRSAQWARMISTYADLRRSLRIYWYRTDKGALAFLAVTFGILAGLGLALQAVFAYQDVRRDREHAVQEASLACLARNIYFEARGEPVAGQFAVAKSP